MNLRTTRIFATIGIAATALGVCTLPASASVDRRPPARVARGLTAQKRLCDFEIDKRIFSLGLARIRVGQVHHLTAAQVDTERAGIDSVISNLNTVNRPAINNATTRPALNMACLAVYLDNRVYAVVIPQLFLTVRADQLGDLGDTLSANIATAKAAGKDTTAAEALAADAKTHLDAAITAVSAVTPAQYNADHAAVNAIFEQVKTDLVAAHDLGVQASDALAAL